MVRFIVYMFDICHLVYSKADCLANGFLINGDRTYQSLKARNDYDEADSTESGTLTLSAWHCQQKCQLDEDCAIFSWSSGIFYGQFQQQLKLYFLVCLQLPMSVN